MSLDECVHCITQEYSYIKIWLLFGEVGAGKTTLAQNLNNFSITSPSFVGYIDYQQHRVLHIDGYFKQNFPAMLLTDYIDQNYTIYIEWPTNSIIQLLQQYTYAVVVVHKDHIYMCWSNNMYNLLINCLLFSMYICRGIK
jgi:tRNA A37 threonylcarbamoyladenosine biosynthesis protein TsaE